MRLSKLLSMAATKATKGKNVDTEIGKIVDTITGAIAAYKGTEKGASKAFKANKAAKTVTTSGALPCGMATLTTEDLLQVIIREQKTIAKNLCDSSEDENFSTNAELARAIATNSTILGACFWLTEDDSENSLL